MRRLPGVLLATAAIVIIIMALLVSGLRFLLPHINGYRPQLLATVESIAGVPVDVGYIAGKWESFGPVLELRDINVKTASADVKAKKNHGCIGYLVIFAENALGFSRSDFLSIAGELPSTVV